MPAHARTQARTHAITCSASVRSLSRCSPKTFPISRTEVWLLTWSGGGGGDDGRGLTGNEMRMFIDALVSKMLGLDRLFFVQAFVPVLT